MSPGGKAIVAVVSVLCILFAVVLIKITANLASVSRPPALCELFGGHWDIWNGWECG